MAILRTEAILLHKQDLRETSLIVTFITRSSGKIKGIMRGVRGPRAMAAAASLELGALDEIVFYERKRGGIFTVSQCDLIDIFPDVRASLERMAQSYYMLELLDAITETGEPNAAIFGLLKDSLGLLSAEARPDRISRIFEIKLLSILGFTPHIGACVGCGGPTGDGVKFSFRSGGAVCIKCVQHHRDAISTLPDTIEFMSRTASSPLAAASRHTAAPKVEADLESLLRKMIDHQLERPLKTVRFLREIGK